eukprot:493914-Rhodomonas_salina.4
MRSAAAPPITPRTWKLRNTADSFRPQSSLGSERSALPASTRPGVFVLHTLYWHCAAVKVEGLHHGGLRVERRGRGGMQANGLSP